MSHSRSDIRLTNLLAPAVSWVILIVEAVAYETFN
jgi:hypothetical protein